MTLVDEDPDHDTLSGIRPDRPITHANRARLGTPLKPEAPPNLNDEFPAPSWAAAIRRYGASSVPVA